MLLKLFYVTKTNVFKFYLKKKRFYFQRIGEKAASLMIGQALVNYFQNAVP